MTELSRDLAEIRRHTMSALSIHPVSSSKQWNDFFALRRQINQCDPAAVFPLKRMERQQLNRLQNPFYQHAEMESFVCYRGDLPVGRIAAIVDHLHNEHQQDEVGFFGFFETIDDQPVVKLLIETASQWLASHGCRAIRGPVNPSMKSDFGVLIEGHEFPPTIMMGHTLARYDRHLMEAGFSVAKSFYAFHFVFSHQEIGWREKFQELQQAQVKIANRYPNLQLRAIDSSNYETTLREINELGNQVRSEGWGFVPLTPAELDFMIKNLRQIIRFDMIHAAYWNDQLVGYIVNIPDVNWALKRTIGSWDWLRLIQLPFLIRRSPRTRVIALGVDAEFRSKGVAMMLIKQLTDNYSAYDEWEFSWVQEDNLKSIRAIERAIPLHRYKTYRLYERKIPIYQVERPGFSD